MRALFRQVPVMDTGARGATNNFARRGLGDVLLAWENEVWLAHKEFGADAFYPSLESSWPSRLSRWLTASWTTTRAPGRLRSPIGIPLYEGSSGDHCEELLPPPRCRGVGAVRGTLSAAEAGYDQGLWRLGQPLQRHILRMAACSIASLLPVIDRRGAAEGAQRRGERRCGERRRCEEMSPPPLAGGGWGEGAMGATRPPPPNPLPQGEGETFLRSRRRRRLRRCAGRRFHFPLQLNSGILAFSDLIRPHTG